MFNKPNVLILMTDQHRFDMMTCAGNTAVPTPNIDRIAKRGVRFENAYCPYPVCVASRSSMLTGLYAHSTGAITNQDRLDWRYKTMAHHFSENGYLTALIGKMHFNDVHNHGFDYKMSINDWLMYLGPKVQMYANEIASHPLSEHFTQTVNDDGAGFPDVALWDDVGPWAGHVTRSDFKSMASEMNNEEHMDAFLIRETIKFLENHKSHPFFLITSLMKPHTPLFAPKEYADSYPIEKETLPEIGDYSNYPLFIQERIKNMKDTPEHLKKAHRAGYKANLKCVDDCIGILYDYLENSGLIDNTIVVYTSDHGEMDGDHGLFQKFCLFDPAVKVPFIVSYPGHLQENVVSDALVELIGLYPTLARLAGTSPITSTTIHPIENAPDSLDAVSFANVVYNPKSQGLEYAFSEYNLRADGANYMLRDRQYKYILNENDIDELYDLINDPGEFNNLINNAEYNDVAQRMKNCLISKHDPDKNPYKGKSENFNPAVVI